jgi:glucosamine--fructose-6-phosphate aminotransferase (isomerizing)
MARSEGCPTLAIVNVQGSSLSREADGAFHLRAGPEVGVASTKAFVNTLGAFYLLGVHLGQVHGSISAARAQTLAAGLADLPALALRTFERADDIKDAGEEFFRDAADAFFLGRQASHGLAMEGALKLKEIGYVHAEGYAAGELKHGPLALLSKDLPVAALLAPNDSTHGVMLSNIAEVRARGAKVLGILCDTDGAAGLAVDRAVRLPASDPLFYPVPASIALYLLAYHAARSRGCPIDRPRNLAKSVTVE